MNKYYVLKTFLQDRLMNLKNSYWFWFNIYKAVFGQQPLVSRSKAVSINELDIRNEIKLRTVKQLEVLSGLRNLQSLIVDLIPKIMALNYDIRKDLRYQQGLEQGEKRGEKKGEKKNRDKMILALLKKGKLSREEIADVAEVSVEYVDNLAKAIE